MYGITETTVHVTHRPLSMADLSLEVRGASPIGVPLPDLRVHLLDRRGQPVPEGVPGEIAVGGAGVARGYLGRPDLTAERFVPDPFGDAGERLYLSGDLARARGDGQLEYIGRIDSQVKVRGFRVETGEIEAALAQHPGVRECAVVVRDGDDDDRRLVAYLAVEPGVSPGTAELRAHLAERLPDYMLPSAFVVLDSLPVTAQGKIDCRALPAPQGARPDDMGAAAPPRGPLEETLAALFCEVLGLDAVGVHDSFFDLGGHSLLAVTLASRIAEALGVELPVRTVFESPTVAGLAALAGASPRAPAGGPELVPVPRGGELPLSFMQERLWFLDQLDPGSTAVNMSLAVRVRGALDPDRLERALAALSARHESLRTSFRAAGGSPVAIVAAHSGLALRSVQRPGLPQEQRELVALEEAQAEAARPFDLAAGPVARASLLSFDRDDHALLVTVHHIAADGWSLGILVGELAALYAAPRGEPAALPELPVQFADHAAWQRERMQGEALDLQLAYWREHLRGAPAHTELPADRPRPRVQRFRGERVHLALDAAMAGQLRALGSAQGATLFMTLLAGFDALVFRQSGQEDVVIGSPVTGRPRRELEHVVGPFLNTVALRVSLAGDPSFRELVGRVREAAVGALQHQDVPFEKVLDDVQPPRDLSRTPMFQLFFNMLNFPVPRADFDGLRFEPLRPPDVPSKFDSHGLRVGVGRRDRPGAGLQRRPVRPRPHRGAGRAVRVAAPPVRRRS